MKVQSRSLRWAGYVCMVEQRLLCWKHLEVIHLQGWNGDGKVKARWIEEVYVMEMSCWWNWLRTVFIGYLSHFRCWASGFCYHSCTLNYREKYKSTVYEIFWCFRFQSTVNWKNDYLSERTFYCMNYTPTLYTSCSQIFVRLKISSVFRVILIFT
jgi:hypothetical protein